MSSQRAETAEGPVEFGELVARSPAMRRLFTRAAALAESGAHLWVAGESGTGKDALARAIHRAGEAPGALTCIDCSAPLAALEAELFGRAANGSRVLEGARGSTLVLDRCEELPLALQERLAGELAAAEVPPPRIIALHRRPLRHELERGRFAPLLHARLEPSELTLPPLRERREDIPAIAAHVLAKVDEARGLTLAPEGAALLSQHDWPGNVRELRNLLERFLYALSAGDPAARFVAPLMLRGDLPELARRAQAAPTFDPDASYRAERARFEAEFEHRYVAWLLERHEGNLSAAARAAAMDRKYLDKLARKHGLKPRR